MFWRGEQGDGDESDDDTAGPHGHLPGASGSDIGKVCGGDCEGKRRVDHRSMSGSDSGAMPSSLEQRRGLLFAALAFAQLDVREPAVDALKTWLGNWRGLGDVIVG